MLHIKVTHSCEIILAFMRRQLGGNRACGRILCTHCRAFSAKNKCRQRSNTNTVMETDARS